MAGPVPLMSQGHNDQQFGYEGAQLHFVALHRDPKNISVSFFFFLVCAPKGESWSHIFLAETVETGDTNRSMTKAMHRKLQEMSSFS